MAQHLDHTEQEQIAEIKAFWKQYGNLVTWALVAAIAAYAALNGWHWWQREQAANAAVMYDELERAANAGDAATAGRVHADLKERYPRTTYAQQGALLAAKAQFDKGQLDAARDALAWLRDQARDDSYRTIARLRLAGVLLDQRKYDEALAELEKADAKDYAGLVADRRGDVLLAQGKKADAKAAYLEARKALDAKLDYRRLVEAKLTSLGVAPEGAL